MPATEKEYHRLPGTGQRRQGFVSAIAIRSRLWLGKAHLLCVDSMGFSEDYKRFYFRDIQAVVIRRTSRGKIWNGVFGGLAALIGLIAIVVNQPVASSIIGGFAGLFLVLLLINIAMGPTSVCHLRSPVQTEELPSLSRLRRARKVLARLQPLIAAAQGRLTPEEITVRMDELNRTQASADPGAAASSLVFDDQNAPPRIVG